MMQEKYKFELSGKQPEVGIELWLRDLKTDNEKIADSMDANANDTQRAGLTKEEHKVYYVTTKCHTCSGSLTVAVNSSKEGIKNLQEAFLRGLNFYCPGCAPSYHHGRRR